MLFNFFKKRNRLAIHTVFIAKENILFLKEWLLYHRYLGFEKFYLYDNSLVQFGGDNEREVSDIKSFKAGEISKYNVKYDSLIDLNQDEVNELLYDIVRGFDNDVKLIKWAPKNDSGQIMYGHVESLYHFKDNYGNQNDWVAFIDMDEYIFSLNGLNLFEYFDYCDNEGIRLLKIFQKKFQCRYSNLNKNVIDIFQCIEDIDTTHSHIKGCWGDKNIVRMKYLKDIRHIHYMSLKRGIVKDMDIKQLRFNHYNTNPILINWMKEWYNREHFSYSIDNSMKVHSDKINFKKENCSPDRRKKYIK